MTNAWKGLMKIWSAVSVKRQQLDKIGGGADIIVAYLQLRLVCVRSPFSFPGRRAIDSLYKSIKGSSTAICRINGGSYTANLQCSGRWLSKTRLSSRDLTDSICRSLSHLLRTENTLFNMLYPLGRQLYGVTRCDSTPVSSASRSCFLLYSL